MKYNYEWDRLKTWLEQYGALQNGVVCAEDIVRLDLSSNSLKSIPQDIGILSKLTVLNLSNNKLESLPESIKNLSSLSNIDLRRNLFNEVPCEIAKLSIKSLNISGNKITDISLLKDSKELMVLDLSNNLIKEIGIKLPQNNSLRSLNLSNNFLKDADVFFSSLSNVQRLNLNNNLFTKIPEAISNMRLLKELDICDNYLQEIDSAIFKLDIESLNLTANRLKVLHLKEMNSLESINLDENSFEKLTIDDNFAPYLKEFSCESCSLKEFLLPQSKYLKTLCYSSNEISFVPYEIADYENLKELDIEKNQIVDLPDSLANLSNLDILYVNENPLSHEAKKVIKILHPEICDINMKTGITIEDAQKEDLREMAGLLSVLFEIESDFDIDFEKQLSGIEKLFEHEGCDMLVAKHENRVVGMLTMQRLISSAEGSYVGQIEDLVVYEEYRKMGVGSRLINRMRNRAQEYGYKRIQLAADMDNSNALKFYTKRGLKKTNLNVYHYKILQR